MKNMKKFLALFLALALCASVLAGCTKTPEETTSETTTESTTEAEASQTETAATTEESTTEESSSETAEGPSIVAENVEPAVEYPAFNVGEITVNLGSAEGGEVSHDAYAGEAGKDYTDEKVYTYNDVMTATTDLNWNPLSWETSDDSYMLSYLSMGFYEFVLNADKTG